MLPTKYYDFMCVANYLKSHFLQAPITAGMILSDCRESENIKKCYEAHKEVFDSIEIDLQNVTKISELLQDNMWFDYFSKTLDTDLGWIDFEKEISMVIKNLDEVICADDDSIYLSKSDLLSAFILCNFRFFADIDEEYEFCEGETYKYNEQYLIEYPHNSGIYIANKNKIFDELYKQLSDFSDTLKIYLCCFVENAFDLLHKDNYTNSHRIELLNLSDSAVTFNYTNTIERFYFNKTAYHIHGTAKEGNIVLGVNPTEADSVGTDNTSLIKFKKYYQREIFGSDTEYIKWYRETIGAGIDYRVITIGHSLDETDKDILSDMFLNAREIYVTYYNESCREDYIKNIIKIFGNDGFNKFKKDQNLEFVRLSNIESLKERIESPRINWSCSDEFNKRPII